MKKLFYLLLVFLFANCSDKINHAEVVTHELNRLLEQKDYFALNESFKANKDVLSPQWNGYFQVFIHKAFGEMDEATSLIDRLLGGHRAELADSLALKLLDIKAANHVSQYNYAKAGAVYADMLTEYGHMLDSLDKVNIENLQLLFNTLANVGRQKKTQASEVVIPGERNAFNHLLFPVRIHGVNEAFIFDTGANFSTITRSQAEKMNLQLFEQGLDVGSSTKIRVQSTLAVADSLYFGEILFEHVVFLVMPDEQLTFPELNYSIKGILGFPVIHQLGEIHLYRNGTIKVPFQGAKRPFKNMALDGLNPVVRAFSEKDTLLFTLDTGARASELSRKFYEEHRDFIHASGRRERNQRGGVGGMTEVEEYILSRFPLRVGTREAVLEDIPVTLEEYGFNRYFDGNLGQDFMGRFNALILNFETMYIDFE